MATPQQDKKPARQNKYFDLHGPVFYPSSFIILVFIVLTLMIGKPMEQVFVNMQVGITEGAGWFFVLVVNILVAFCLYIAFSRFGKIRLGGARASPDFSTFAWFSMLFSAGMGIGLLFFGVAEPITHYSNPPVSPDNPAQQAHNAMKYTFLHWGLHAWAIYAAVGLALAFFSFNWKLPLSIRSIMYPVFGERIHGPVGHIIDTIAVVATLFGLATSLGYGAGQVNSGINFLFGVEIATWVQVVLISGITLAATISVVLGIDKGVRVLSELNIRIGLVFLILMIILGPTVFLLDGFIQNTGAYLQGFFQLSTWGAIYTDPGADASTYHNDWTVFFWAWWISWSPFVGMFIARVSRGRTIREFLLGVLLVPSLLTFLWISVFGNAALYLEINDMADITTAVNENISTALFVMLEEYPLTILTSVIGIVLVTSFFVTSSDSGSLVIDSITSGGKLDAPVGQRIFWAVTEGAVAATLLIGGGLKALQTAAIVTGLPFAIILLIMCYSLYKGLQEEWEMLEKEAREQQELSYRQIIGHLVAKTKQKAEQSETQES